MALIYHELNIPLDTDSTFDYIVIKQGDAGSHKVRATLINNNSVFTIPTSNATYYFKFRKPDNTYVLVQATVSNNQIIADVTEEMLRVAGTGRGEFMIVQGSTELKTATFYFKIVQQTYTTDDVISSSDFATFASLLAGAGNAASKANAAAAAANTAAANAEAKADLIPDDYTALVQQVEDIQDELENLDVETDATLTEQGKPADAKATGDAIAELNGSLDELQNTVDVINDSIVDLGGLTDNQKSALLACFRNVAWKGTDGTGYYNLLEAALYDINIVSISATYNGGSAIIFTDTPLNAVKQYLLVTALAENGARIVVTDYALSGSLIDGTSVLTVTYRGKTTTVNVPAYAETLWISGYDANNATRVAYHVAPFICGTDQYQYDYSRKIIAIETNFVVAGKLTIGKYTAPLSDGKAFDIQTNWTAITTVDVPTTGLQKIRIDPITLLNGESLTFGENSLIGGDDSAFWNYGENGVDKGFYSSNYNGNKITKNNRSLGMNVYTIRG